MNPKCIIIDDEPLAIELIEAYIEQLGNIKVQATFRNPAQAFIFLKENPVDLVFLDIHMPVMSGLEFLRSLNDPPGVIFTTAYREYALDGYDLNVVDYLLKPITFERFLKAIDKYYKSSLLPSLPGQITSEFIFVKVNRKNIKVRFSEILFVESKKDYIKIKTKADAIIVKEKISQFEESLPQQLFLRIHRSFLVNIDKITGFTNQDVEIGSLEIPIGGTYRDEVLKALKNGSEE